MLCPYNHSFLHKCGNFFRCSLIRWNIIPVNTICILCNTFDVSGHLIQSKWDVFSLGQTFSEILKRSKIELSDESVKIPLHKLITDMISLHPLKRPSIKECIERFIILIPHTLVAKYELEFNELFKIAREQLEIEIEIHTPQSQSDYSSGSDIELDLSDED